MNRLFDGHGSVMPVSPRPFRAALLAVCGLVPALLAAQGVLKPASSDGAISGVVTDAATGLPLPGALVHIGAVHDAQYAEADVSQLTDAKGRFVFVDLPAADYDLTTERNGYFFGGYGQAEAFGGWRLIPLRDGQWFDSANVALRKYGGISGRVTDEQGEALVNVAVQALARVTIAGVEHLAASNIALTDDRGVYRLTALPAGRYAVMVPSAPATLPASAMHDMASFATEAMRRMGPGRPGIEIEAAIETTDTMRRLVMGRYPIPPPDLRGQTFTYPMTFAGGTSIASARSIVLQPGHDADDVDVQLVPVAATRVSGRVAGPPNAATGLALRLFSDELDGRATGQEAGLAVVGADGTFAFWRVPAGNYTIEALPLLGQYTLQSPPDQHFYGLRSLGMRLPSPAGGLPGFGLNGQAPSSAPSGIGFETSSSSRSRFWGRASISVSAQPVDNLVLSLRPTLTVQGRFVQDKPCTSIDSMSFVQLETANGDPRAAVPWTDHSPNCSDTFGFSAVLPGAYVFHSDSNWEMIKSVVAAGRDYTDVPIELASDLSNVVVTFTTAIPSLNGTVRDRSGQAITESSVVVAFPADPARWTNYGLSPRGILSTLTAADGTFRFRRIPAGDYAVVAVSGGSTTGWQAPGFFARSIGGATRVSIGWGDHKQADVRLPVPQ